MNEMRLNDLKIGQKAKVEKLNSKGALRRRIMDMGITPGAVVFMRKTAPFGDPLEINVRGYELSLRKDDAEQIIVVTDE